MTWPTCVGIRGDAISTRTHLHGRATQTRRDCDDLGSREDCARARATEPQWKERNERDVPSRALVEQRLGSAIREMKGVLYAGQLRGPQRVEHVRERYASSRALHRGHLLAAASSVQAGVVLVAAVIASTADIADSTVRLMLIGSLALAMGGQNAVVRRLAVPDLTTTVLTLTVTGLVADTTSQSVRGRRLISVLAMLGGALTGGVLLRWVAIAAPLWLAAVLLAACAAGTYTATRRPQSLTWR
jgi:hypothetical protein